MARYCFSLFLSIFVFFTSLLNAVAFHLVDNSLQAIVILTEDWNSSCGLLRLYSRDSVLSPWTLNSKICSVALGSKGLAWGIGQRPLGSEFLKEKAEGDLRSPAGIFALGRVFGFDDLSFSKMPYLKISPYMEAVDDPNSAFYNMIVDSSEIYEKDWVSSEKMLFIPVYRLGIEIVYNFPTVIKGAGSAIFMHLEGFRPRTAGCAALKEDDLLWLLTKLDVKNSPVLILMPQFEFENYGKMHFNFALME